MTRFTIALAVIIAFFGVFVNGRHIHLAEEVDSSNPDITELKTEMEIEGLSIDAIRNFKPSGFVPMNNILFFKAFPPCKDGFKRDVLGICREVWD